MEKNIISIIHFQKPSILSWNAKCPFLPSPHPVPHHHQPNKSQPQKNRQEREPGVSGDISECYCNKNLVTINFSALGSSVRRVCNFAGEFP